MKSKTKEEIAKEAKEVIKRLKDIGLGKTAFDEGNLIVESIKKGDIETAESTLKDARKILGYFELHQELLRYLNGERDEFKEELVKATKFLEMKKFDKYRKIVKHILEKTKKKNFVLPLDQLESIIDEGDILKKISEITKRVKPETKKAILENARELLTEALRLRLLFMIVYDLEDPEAEKVKEEYGKLLENIFRIIFEKTVELGDEKILKGEIHKKGSSIFP